MPTIASLTVGTKQLLQSLDRAHLTSLARSVSSLGLARIVGMVVPFITIPLALHHLDAERFGLWMAATSFLGVLMLADGGIANSLVTSVSVSQARGDRQSVQSLVTNATVIVGVVALALLPIGALAAWGINWAAIFSLRNPLAIAEAPVVVFLVIAAAALNLWVNVFIKLQYGLQRIVRASLWELGAVTVSLPAFLLCLALDAGTPSMVVALTIVPILIRGVGGGLFLLRERDLRPQLGLLSRPVQRELFASGSMYLFLEIAITLSVTSDQFFVAALVSAKAVPAYTVFYRLYSLPIVLVSLVFQTQWPHYAQAAAQGRHAWIRRSFFISMLLGCGFALVAALLLSATHPLITQLWLGAPLAPPAYLVPAMAAYTVLGVFEYGGRSLLYSLNRRRALMLCSLAMVVVNLTLKLMLLPAIGSAGAMIGTDIAFTVCMVLPYIWFALGVSRPSKTEQTSPEPVR